MNLTNVNIFYANGNLLISGEYFVLVGAKALAIPLKYGQQMRTSSIVNENSKIHWEVFEKNNLWFEAEFDTKNLDILFSTNQERASWLKKLLRYLAENSEVFNTYKSHYISCNIEFNTKWGWGSSSSLICNLASWAQLDPYIMHTDIFSGSGYDIATSLARSPIVFQLKENKPNVQAVQINPALFDFIHFVYLGNKVSSDESIKANKQVILENKHLIQDISHLTEKIADEDNPDELIKTITEHEKIISETLKITPVKKQFFSDFDGGIKSLGAWGGDFVMIVSQQKDTYIKEYFNNKGLETVFKVDEIIRN